MSAPDTAYECQQGDDEDPLQSALAHLTVAREQIALLVGTIVIAADDDCGDVDPREVSRARRSGALVAGNIDAALAEIRSEMRQRLLPRTV